jgi:hypothetical protein
MRCWATLSSAAGVSQFVACWSLVFWLPSFRNFQKEWVNSASSGLGPILQFGIGGL